MSPSDHAALSFPFPDLPGPGEAVEVAEGVLWIAIPLPMALKWVNVVALDDGDGWTLVDTGTYTQDTVKVWEQILAGPLRGKPVTRIISTHHHPDHVGMLGWFMTNHGVEHWSSRTTYLLTRMLVLDEEPLPTQAAITYWKRAGMPAEKLAKRMSERPFNFADIVHPVPVGHTRIQQGDVIRAGGRDWDVHMGNGHAPEHVTLWSRDDNLVIAGDQVLPTISPNVGVQPAEPEADPLADWLEACERLQTLAREDHFVIGGHKLPFTGLPRRMNDLIVNHHTALDRLKKHIAEPRVAVDCFSPLFKREIVDAIYGLAMVEAYAHLQHLHRIGQASRTLREDGAYMWQTL
ncbi:MBL fold metallo-hydrolase [Pseudooceanicola sp. C21-150M6]|uniref:MBL fold metallo-hydrolase n=1 Tax=Pseudooceanicola sp. C21-150M6 TaxID=3434355 RepID=UPI003D7F2BC2